MSWCSPCRRHSHKVNGTCLNWPLRDSTWSVRQQPNWKSLMPCFRERTLSDLSFLLLVVFGLKHLVYLVSKSYVCQVHITNRPYWQDELHNCQLYTGLDRSMSVLYRFPAAAWAWLDHMQQIFGSSRCWWAGQHLANERAHIHTLFFPKHVTSLLFLPQITASVAHLQTPSTKWVMFREDMALRHWHMCSGPLVVQMYGLHVCW